MAVKEGGDEKERTMIVAKLKSKRIVSGIDLTVGFSICNTITCSWSREGEP